MARDALPPTLLGKAQLLFGFVLVAGVVLAGMWARWRRDRDARP